MEKYLKDSNGVSGSQEVLMQILMDPEICNFTLGEANAARKAIAKKIAAKIIQLKKDFFEKGNNCGTREDFLNYVWVYCIEPQLGYSFSINHTVPYSVVAVQEANLATRWNPLYWQCACLCVNSGNYVGEIGEDEEDEDIEEIQEEVEEEQKAKKVNRKGNNDFDSDKLNNLKKQNKLSNMFEEGEMLDYYDLSTERGKRAKKKIKPLTF